MNNINEHLSKYWSSWSESIVTSILLLFIEVVVGIVGIHPHCLDDLRCSNANFAQRLKRFLKRFGYHKLRFCVDFTENLPILPILSSLSSSLLNILKGGPPSSLQQKLWAVRWNRSTTRGTSSTRRWALCGSAARTKQKILLHSPEVNKAATKCLHLAHEPQQLGNFKIFKLRNWYVVCSEGSQSGLPRKPQAPVTRGAQSPSFAAAWTWPNIGHLT